MARLNAFRDGQVHVCDHLCSTCIFRPGNLMRLEGGRVREMVSESLANDTAIICHKTLDKDNAVCRGFFDRHKLATLPLRMAIHCGVIVYDNPDD